MIELTRHIERLLLENDCVIVPGLGGFVAHYNEAMWQPEENLFVPPSRVIGFNPQLRLNDGLLVQSVMEVYGTHFADATKRVGRWTEALQQQLYEEGRVELPNIGELRMSIRGTYGFTPYDAKVASPGLYGLGSFEMQPLAAEAPHAEPVRAKVVAMPPVARPAVRLSAQDWWRSVAAVAAVVVLFFLFSTPVKNTEGTTTGQTAQLLPEELFGQIEAHSLVAHPVVEVSEVASVKKQNASSEKKESVSSVKKEAANVATVKATSPVKSEQTASATTSQVAKTVEKAVVKPYHLIVASVGTERDAKAMRDRLVSEGHKEAKAIIGDGKMRVSLCSYATEAEAYQAVNRLRQEGKYAGAWVLRKKM